MSDSTATSQLFVDWKHVSEMLYNSLTTMIKSKGIHKNDVEQVCSALEKYEEARAAEENDDIVSALRTTTVADPTYRIYQVMSDAAAEIEQLRTAKDYWKSVAEQWRDLFTPNQLNEKIND